jgi:hypothetical protein
VTEFFSSLIRGLFMLAVGVLVLVVAAVLLVFTLAMVLVAAVWGLLNGRKPTAGAGWTRFRQSTASTVWQRYREQATRKPATPAADRRADVEDVAFRDVTENNPAPRPSDVPRQVER